MFQKIELRRTRDFSAKVNATFEFLRQNFKVMAKCLIFISGPFILLQGLFNGLYQKEIFSFDPVGAGIFGSFLGNTFMWLGISLIFLMFGYIISLIVVFEFIRLYEIKENPESIDVPEIWETVKKYVFPMIGAVIASAILISVGLILLVIPGIYLAVVLTLIAPIMIIERKSFGDAFSRSFKLISEKWWSTFGLIFVTTMIAGFMAFVFAIPQYIFTFLIAFHKTSDTGSQPELWQQAGLIIGSMVYSFGAGLLQSIVFIAIAFQFYNLVERREAQGLMNKVESFGRETDQPSKHEETY
jgi:MFS family permease